MPIVTSNLALVPAPVCGLATPVAIVITPFKLWLFWTLIAPSAARVYVAVLQVPVWKVDGKDSRSYHTPRY